MPTIVRYILFWLPMPLLGIANGMLRELVIRNFAEELLAHKISVFTLIILIFCYGLIIRSKININTTAAAITCGITWVVLTVVFEFGFGHFVFAVPYEKLLYDYNVSGGRLWPLVLFFTGLLPFMLKKLHPSP